MAAADKKITYTAAEEVGLIRSLTQSVEALQKENAELKRKLAHINGGFSNAQRVQYGRSSEKKTDVLVKWVRTKSCPICSPGFRSHPLSSMY